MSVWEPVRPPPTPGAASRARIAPHCRLAAQRSEYDDEHSRCTGMEVVNVPGQAPITTQVCECSCHQSREQA